MSTRPVAGEIAAAPVTPVKCMGLVDVNTAKSLYQGDMLVRPAPLSIIMDMYEPLCFLSRVRARGREWSQLMTAASWGLTALATRHVADDDRGCMRGARYGAGRVTCGAGNSGTGAMASGRCMRAEVVAGMMPRTMRTASEVTAAPMGGSLRAEA
jgi:hypothetical protein